MPTIHANQLREITTAIFAGLGASEHEAEVVSNHLVDANLMGHDSHGVFRIVQYTGFLRNGNIVPGAPIEILNETPSSAVVDGKWGFGQIIARRATELAIEKAGNCAVACVTARNCNHVGRVGEYPSLVAAQGMIGIASVNNHGSGLVMSVHGGTGKRLSPNPISIALPTGSGSPIVLDATSSVVAAGKLHVKRSRGEQLPEGWIADANGNPSTDPEDYYAGGAVLPLGGSVGHKGFGLALVFDVLCGALSGAGCSRGGDARIGNGFFMTVIDIAKFVDLDSFQKEVDTLLDYVKSSPLAPGFDEILVPGEPEQRVMEQRLREGIYVGDAAWQEIRAIGESVGVSVPEFG